MRRALLLLAGMTALSMPAVAVHAQPAPMTVLSASDSYADLIAEAAQHFAIPAAWIRAIMRIESRGDRRAISPKGAMGLMQLMPETWAALRTRYGLGRDPFNAHDNILAGTMRGPGDTRIIATGIVRCRLKRSPMSRRSSLLSGTARPMGLSSWRPPIRRPGHRRRFSSCDRQALNLSIARRPNRRRTTRRPPWRCATCRPSHRNPMGCSSTFPQRGRSRDRAALPSTCRYIASVSPRFPCRFGGFRCPWGLHRCSWVQFHRQARHSVLPERRKGRQGRSADTNRSRAR